MKHNFVAQFVQLWKLWLCYVQSGAVMEKNWARSVGQRWLQELPFSGHLIHLLDILLKCNGCARIQKAVVDQTGSSPSNSDHDLSLTLGSALELLLSPTTELVIIGCCIKSIFHCTSQSDEEIVHCCCLEEKTTLQNNDFLKFSVSS